MESQPCVFLGIKVKSGPIERFKLENFTLDNTIDKLRDQAEKKTGLPSSSLGKIEFMEGICLLKHFYNFFFFLKKN